MKTALMITQVVVSLALIGVVLLQKSKGEGLGSIGGGTRMFFDQARGFDRVLERATEYLAVAFMLVSVVLSIV